MRRFEMLLLAAVLAAGCGKNTTSGGDAGLADAGPTDAGLTDAGETDAGPVDAGPVDAGDVDAGDVDAGPLDAGDVDAGPPNGTIRFVNVEDAVGITSDGTTALMMTFGASDTLVFLYDTTTDTLSQVTRTGDNQDPITGIAPNGGKLIGFHGTSPIQAGIWTADAGWLDLGSGFDGGCDPNASSGWGLSADGTIAVGLDWNGCVTNAFRWQDGVFTELQHIGDVTGSERASVISDDGAVMGGFASSLAADRSPAIWYADAGGFALDPTMQVIGEVLTLSHDGQMAAGIWNGLGFYWTADAGVVQIPGLPNTGGLNDSTFESSIAANNQLIFGNSGNAWDEGNWATVWTRASGLQKLQDIVASQRIAIPNGYVLTSAVAASSDGSIVVGNALDNQPQPAPHVFILKMPVDAYGL
ncbi:MAG: hypothetical protein JST54_22560 [Deltaproteobacteria bacterium]|nr:hypothetical protein [Deltaproteobacteria bacterium]